MKPTDRMKPAADPPPEPAADDALAPLVERRQAIARALRETKEAADGRLARAIDEQVRAAVAAATDPPNPGPTGTVTARVVGLVPDEKATHRAPLEGVTVRLKVGGEARAEGPTNALGVVVLAVPGRESAAYEVEVLGQDCAVVGCQHGQFDPARPTAHLFELPRTDALAAGFARSGRWVEAEKAAAAKARELKAAVSKALAAQQKELTAALADVDKRIAGAGRRDPAAPAQPEDA